jgi:hypothetical protein
MEVFMPFEKKKYFPEAVIDRSQEVNLQAYNRTWVAPAAVKTEFGKYEFCGVGSLRRAPSHDPREHSYRTGTSPNNDYFYASSVF